MRSEGDEPVQVHRIPYRVHGPHIVYDPPAGEPRAARLYSLYQNWLRNHRDPSGALFRPWRERAAEVS